ncbi:MAG: histidine phosphatase family protein [Pseudomonadota bacterium]
MINVSVGSPLAAVRLATSVMAFGALIAFPSLASAEAPKTEPVANKNMPVGALIEAMQKGGTVIYIRHASTEKDYADQVSAKMGNCATQRTLSEAGWKEAKAIGRAFKKNKVPHDSVVSSEYCRAWQTADLAFNEYDKNAALNFAPAEEYTEEQWAGMKNNIMPLLTKAPKEGTNAIIVAHDDPFEAATGIYPEPMGVTYVIMPKGDSFEILGSIAPDKWNDAK